MQHVSANRSTTTAHVGNADAAVQSTCHSDHVFSDGSLTRSALEASPCCEAQSNCHSDHVVSDGSLTWSAIEASPCCEVLWQRGTEPCSGNQLSETLRGLELTCRVDRKLTVSSKWWRGVVILPSCQAQVKECIHHSGDLYST